jgi:RNA polymerase sigma factor (sigma-70 family)
MREVNSKQAFLSSELQRINDKYVRPTVIGCFSASGFKFWEDDVCEVIAESDMRIAMYIDRYDESISKGAWFVKIANSCAFAYMKRENKWRNHHESMEVTTFDGETYEIVGVDCECGESSMADMRMLSEENVAIIEKALNSLGKESCRIMELKSQGYSDSEIVEALGVASGAYRTRVSRARKCLRENKEIKRLCVELFGSDYSNVA